MMTLSHQSPLVGLSAPRSPCTRNSDQLRALELCSLATEGTQEVAEKKYAGPLMVRAYLSERATCRSGCILPLRGGLGRVMLSFSSFLLRRKKRTILFHVIKKKHILSILKCLAIVIATGRARNWAEPLLFVVTPKEEIADGILIHLRFQHPAEPRLVRRILIATFRHGQ